MRGIQLVYEVAGDSGEDSVLLQLHKMIVSLNQANQ